MSTYITRSNAAFLIERLASALALTGSGENITFVIAENGNVFVDGMLAATIREPKEV
jgi:hypothetical protein